MDHWEIIKSQAEKCRDSSTEWKSFIQEKRYRIKKVFDKKIVIERLDSGSPAEVGEKGVNKSIEKLKNSGRLKKTDLYDTVAIESTLVYLHPSIHWDKQTSEIYWKGSTRPSLEITKLFIEEANDDELQKIQVEINKRTNQSKFRKSVIQNYKSTCAISGTQVEEVLEAAHINQHANKGDNKIQNGILLRADLHILFDRNLILVHPEKLSIHLSPALSGPEYVQFEGKTIFQGTIGIKREYLQNKWNNATWAR
jgi:hypothetical protein